MPLFVKSGNLNLLEPPGPVQDCTGIAVPWLRMNLSSVRNRGIFSTLFGIWEQQNRQIWYLCAFRAYERVTCTF